MMWCWWWLKVGVMSDLRSLTILRCCRDHFKDIFAHFSWSFQSLRLFPSPRLYSWFSSFLWAFCTRSFNGTTWRHLENSNDWTPPRDLPCVCCRRRLGFLTILFSRCPLFRNTRRCGDNSSVRSGWSLHSLDVKFSVHCDGLVDFVSLFACQFPILIDSFSFNESYVSFI